MGELNELKKEIIEIAKTGTMPDGDHVQTHVMNWFCEWAKKIEVGIDEHKHVWIEGPDVICHVCGKWK